MKRSLCRGKNNKSFNGRSFGTNVQQSPFFASTIRVYVLSTLKFASTPDDFVDDDDDAEAGDEAEVVNTPEAGISFLTSYIFVLAEL